MLLLLLCTPICAEDLHLPNWQSTNAGESYSTSSYTYKFTTSSSGSTLSFDWRVSSESGYDFLTITLDGAQILKESGTKSSSYSKYLNDDNEHTLVCTYSKDGSVDNGDDCASVNNVVVRNVNNTSNPVVIPNNTIYYTSEDGKEKVRGNVLFEDIIENNDDVKESSTIMMCEDTVAPAIDASNVSNFLFLSDTLSECNTSQNSSN